MSVAIAKNVGDLSKTPDQSLDLYIHQGSLIPGITGQTRKASNRVPVVAAAKGYQMQDISEKYQEATNGCFLTKLEFMRKRSAESDLQQFGMLSVLDPNEKQKGKPGSNTATFAMSKLQVILQLKQRCNPMQPALLFSALFSE